MDYNLSSAALFWCAGILSVTIRTVGAKQFSNLVAPANTARVASNPRNLPLEPRYGASRTTVVNNLRYGCCSFGKAMPTGEPPTTHYLNFANVDTIQRSANGATSNPTGIDQRPVTNAVDDLNVGKGRHTMQRGLQTSGRSYNNRITDSTAYKYANVTYNYPGGIDSAELPCVSSLDPRGVRLFRAVDPSFQGPRTIRRSRMPLPHHACGRVSELRRFREQLTPLGSWSA